MIGEGDPISTIIDKSAPRNSLCFFHYGLAGALVCVRKHGCFFFIVGTGMAAVLVWQISGICQQNAGPVYCIAHGLWWCRDNPQKRTKKKKGHHQ